MADPQHVELAKRKTYAIARWREQHWRGRERLDLSGAYLSGARLPSADLSNDDLSGADLTGADLRRADLSRANLRGTHLSRSSMGWANLRRADMQGVSLGRTDLTGSCMQGANLRGADLSYAELSFTDLRGADLTGADLTETNLSMADLTGACLGGARMTGTILDVANLTGVDLRRASLVRALLDRSLFSEVTLDLTLFADCDLSQILGLESVYHAGPSIIGLDSLARSRGLIPAVFLRQAGVAEPLIAVQKHLELPPGGYSRNLLINSVEDLEFVNRLQADLRLAGLACWQLSVDDEEVHSNNGAAPPEQRLTYYDHLLLVCSEHSLGSPQGWRLFDQIAQKYRPAAAWKQLVTCLALDKSIYAGQDRLRLGLLEQPLSDFQDWRQEGAYQDGLRSLVTNLANGPQRAVPEELSTPIPG